MAEIKLSVTAFNSKIRFGNAIECILILCKTKEFKKLIQEFLFRFMICELNVQAGFNLHLRF